MDTLMGAGHPPRLPYGCSVSAPILVAVRNYLTILRLLNNRILTLDVDKHYRGFSLV